MTDHASIIREIERAEATLARVLELAAELGDGEATDAAVTGLDAWIGAMTDKALGLRSTSELELA